MPCLSTLLSVLQRRANLLGTVQLRLLAHQTSNKGSQKKSTMADSGDPPNEALIQRMARNYVKWQPVSNQPVQPSPGETDFTVMTYNILAQTNLDAHPKLYEHIPADVLLWSYRREKILAEILFRNCEIVCLQEVQEDHLLDFLAPKLSAAGYQYVYKRKTGDKMEGCAIFWKRDVFGLLHWDAVEMFVPTCRTLNRDNVGIVVVLSPRNNRHSKFCVTTTHLIFNTRRGDVKLAQLRYLLASVERHAFLGTSQFDRSTPVYMPIIFCGDLNSKPFSPLYNFIRNGQIHLDGLLHSEVVGNKGGHRYFSPMEINVGGLLPCTMFEDDFIARYGIESINSLSAAYEQMFVYHLFGKFNSCYGHRKRDADEVTSFADDPLTVDYIFYQQTRLLRHVATLSVMTEAELTNIGGIPSVAFGSDHLSLAARFILKAIPRDFLMRN